MTRRSASRYRLAAVGAAFGLVALLVLTAAAPAEAQALLKVNDTVVFKFGALLQVQADWLELVNASNTDTVGYQENLFLRRARFMFGGRLAKSVYFYLDTENSNLGKNKTGTSALGSGFQLLDGFGEWRLSDAFMLAGGLLRVPYSRTALTAAGSQFVLDTPSTTYLQQTQTRSTGGNRDTGFLARGFFVDHRLEYRVGMFQGDRQTGSHNPFRVAGRLQFNFLDREDMYSPSYIGSTSYPGSYLGDKKVLALGAGFDTQMSYHYYSADLFGSIPFGDGAFESTLQYQYIDGDKTFPTIPVQNTFDVDFGYYIKAIKVAPLVRYEQRVYNGQQTRDEYRLCAGLNWYLFKYNLNLKGLYQRITPKTGPAQNEFTLQLQLYYW
ncbi:MAG TPA: hypothetical protein PLB02_04290 [Thermoanaerobaculia bacterium]|nr:hypothetical protein [Thermoanaerobaculia bacterium]HQR66590.1 hypothetical protein [Thermoanaerobaculia bacterium]